MTTGHAIFWFIVEFYVIAKTLAWYINRLTRAGVVPARPCISWGCDDDDAIRWINPGSSLPMISGPGGIDVGGSPFGENLSAEMFSRDDYGIPNT